MYRIKIHDIKKKLCNVFKWRYNSLYLRKQILKKIKHFLLYLCHVDQTNDIGLVNIIIMTFVTI